MTTTYQAHFGAELPKATALVSNMPKKLMDGLARKKPSRKMAVANKLGRLLGICCGLGVLCFLPANSDIQ